MGTRKSTTAGQHRFSQIPAAEIQRSQFDRSCGLKTTFDSGVLIPIFMDEALPGDTFNMSMTTFGRMATPLHPIMDNLYMDFHFFAVPNRLLWDNWQKFCGEQTDPGDSTDFLIPTVATAVGGDTASGKLNDYLGIPHPLKNFNVNSFWHRAYNLIWNEWFRDQNLQDSVAVNTGNGPDARGDYVILRRGKRHDYFTSCLPFPQKGPSVELPLGSSAPLVFDTPAGTAVSTGDDIPRYTAAGATNDWALEAASSGSTANINPNASSFGGVADMEWDDPKLAVDLTGVADLSSATASTINTIRQAFQIQRLYERDARGGTRYTEILRSHFGVTSPDQRLQRPEYLGGGTSNINIAVVPQTSSSDATSDQGHLTGYGTTSTSGIGWTKSFVEHCVILGLVSVRADLNYQQGVHRQFTRSTRWDFFWPSLAHLGEQAVLNQEIYAQGADDPGTEDTSAFGYQERFAEYRYKPSMVTGQMRSSDPISLDTWHLAQDFSTIPLLDDTFIQENPPVARVVAVPSEPEFILDLFFKYKCARPMPTYSVPGMIDHF